MARPIPARRVFAQGDALSARAIGGPWRDRPWRQEPDVRHLEPAVNRFASDGAVWLAFGSPGKIAFGDNSFCGKSLRVQGRNKGRLSLLCTNAERIVVRIGRYVGCEADVKELRLFPQSIDDLTDQALSDARSCENLFVFRENVFRDEVT